MTPARSATAIRGARGAALGTLVAAAAGVLLAATAGTTGHGAGVSAGPGGNGRAGPAVAGTGREADASDTLLVAVLRHRDTAAVYSDAPARLVAVESGRTVARAGPYRSFHFLTAGGGATAWGSWGELETSADRLRVVPERDEGVVFIDGRPHRGQAEIVHLPDSTLVVASRVDRRAYLVSVVSAELGDGGLTAFQAAKAQAVAARTYTVGSVDLGVRDSLGVDLVADPEVDQAYPGLLAEREAGRRAVRETDGQVLIHGGRLARTYYHSTCGGRTARPDEIWDERARPYLPSLVDAPEGDARRETYCAASPHHRWRRSWSADELRRSVGAAAARSSGRPTGTVRAVRSVEVTGRTEHGRATELTVVLDTEGAGRDGGDDAPDPSGATRTDTLLFGTRAIPRVLVDPDGRPLRSTWFDVTEAPEDGGLALAGRGSGHGVGMCQWGAVERARRGAGWRQILETYYPGTEVRRPERAGAK